MKVLEILNKLKNKMLNFTSKDVEEAIAELKALQQPKSCDECKYYTSTLCPVEEFSIASAELEKYPFYCNRHKPKEQ